jgi:flagellar basal-body rod protein FlgB
MDYSGINIMRMMQVKLGYLSERQDVLAGNIANIDTPGARAKDLKKLDFERLAMAESRRLRIRATSGSHITEPARKRTEFRAEEQRKTYETTPVKNAIVLEEQMMKIAETQMQHQKIVNLYNKTADMFNTAIGKR